MIRMQPHAVVFFQPLGELPSGPGPVHPREFLPEGVEACGGQRARAARMRLIRERVEAAVAKAAEPAANALLTSPDYARRA